MPLIMIKVVKANKPNECKGTPKGVGYTQIVEKRKAP